MHDDTELVLRRIQREVAERLVPAMYSEVVPFRVESWEAPGEPVPFHVAADSEYQPFEIGSRWSRPWGTTWFRMRGDVPQQWVGDALEAVIDLGFHADSAGFQSEGLVWLGGLPLQGVHPRRTGVPLPTSPAGPIELLVEAAANPAVWGVTSARYGSLASAGDRPLYTLRRADLCRRDDAVFHLLLDVEVLLGLVHASPADDPRRHRLVRTLEAAFDRLDLAAVAATATAAREALAPALARRGAPDRHRVIAVGHAHIDTAWLWPIRETMRKCARTFASATRLMDDHADHHFACSQAAQYAWIEDQHPALFAAIGERIDRGQWEVVGGMWVEADMNLPSGESLVRQLVHGQRWFESRFGRRCDEIWLPDVFGYPATLPQVFAAAGCHRFVTQKLSWNKQNRFPHHTFWWEGLDGTRVLAHFPPVDTYNAEVSAAELVHDNASFREHRWSDVSLLPFGYGDGGGGPTREMVERARRMADLDGLPLLSIGTVDSLFEAIEAEVAAGAPVPTWRGELYFEMHRGTLTTQAATKVGNRRCERLLREAELWWTSGGDVPGDVVAELDGLWKEVLVQQFHDILPGSSIAWVHADAEAVHAKVGARLEELIALALQRISPPVGCVANAATCARDEVVASEVAPEGGGPRQLLADGSTAFVVSVPGLGVAAAAPSATPHHRVVVTERSFSNGLVAVSWSPDGDISSIIDVRAAREVLPLGRMITLDLAPDHPIEYDAWDVESWTHRRGAPVKGVSSVEVVDAGPLVASLIVRRAFGRSSAEQTITLRAGTPRVDITVDVDWHEDERLLSLMVPLDVHAAEASCDIQFGVVRRPTHPSSSLDAAKFEVCAHRFVDVAEPSWGVAVLNDGRFGHGLFEGGVRVSLLRAPKYPDATADHGRHRVVVAIAPHGHGLHEVIREAQALNTPLRVVPGGVAEDLPPPVVTIDHPGVEVSAVKRADDASGDLIVRLSEACGDRANVTVRTPRRIVAAARCDLLEDPQRPLDTTDGLVVLALRPFELVTLRLTTDPD